MCEFHVFNNKNVGLSWANISKLVRTGKALEFALNLKRDNFPFVPSVVLILISIQHMHMTSHGWHRHLIDL